VTADSTGGKSTRDYADIIMTRKVWVGTERDGMLFLIDFDIAKSTFPLPACYQLPD